MRHPAGRSAYRQEFAALRSLYAAKIAAVYLYATKHEVNAMVAAVRSEERAALNALRERQAKEFSHHHSRRVAARKLRPQRPAGFRLRLRRQPKLPKPFPG
jgi:hypothetical protein